MVAKGDGTCDCFDGYKGTACLRASCPNDCSGHDICETIKELAEMKFFDTTAEDVPTTTPVSATTGHHEFDLAIEESYAYDLWDQDKTMGITDTLRYCLHLMQDDGATARSCSRWNGAPPFLMSGPLYKKLPFGFN